MTMASTYLKGVGRTNGALMIGDFRPPCDDERRLQAVGAHQRGIQFAVSLAEDEIGASLYRQPIAARRFDDEAVQFVFGRSSRHNVMASPRR